MSEESERQPNPFVDIILLLNVKPISIISPVHRPLRSQSEIELGTNFHFESHFPTGDDATCCCDSYEKSRGTFPLFQFIVYANDEAVENGLIEL